MTDDTPTHQRRRSPTLGDFIEAMLLTFPCAECGEPILHRRNLDYDHRPPLSDRLDAELWHGINPNDPRYIDLRHRHCHRKRSAIDQTARFKAKRNRVKHDAHKERLAAFPLPKPKVDKPRHKWPSRPFQKRKFP